MMVRADVVSCDARTVLLQARCAPCWQNLAKVPYVAEMVSRRARTGHTAVSWAAAVGETDILGLLLSKGGPPAHQDQLLHMAAKVIQVAYHQHKFYMAYVQLLSTACG